MCERLRKSVTYYTYSTYSTYQKLKNFSILITSFVVSLSFSSFLNTNGARVVGNGSPVMRVFQI